MKFGRNLENFNSLLGHRGHPRQPGAIPGRVTAGRERDGKGIHVGLSASYREGEFDRVSFRPEVQEADRIVLSQPRADTLGIVGQGMGNVMFVSY